MRCGLSIIFTKGGWGNSNAVAELEGPVAEGVAQDACGVPSPGRGGDAMGLGNESDALTNGFQSVHERHILEQGDLRIPSDPFEDPAVNELRLVSKRNPGQPRPYRGGSFNQSKGEMVRVDGQIKGAGRYR